MKRIGIAVLALLLLASTSMAVDESMQRAVQNFWQTVTFNDTIATSDFNRWDFTTAANHMEYAKFTADQAGSLVWWNGDSDYAAPTNYTYFNAGDGVEITAKGGLDSLEVHNTSASTLTGRLAGGRR